MVKGPRVKTDRCLDLLRRGRKGGFYLPRSEEVTAVLVGLLGQGTGVTSVELALKLAREVEISY